MEKTEPTFQQLLREERERSGGTLTAALQVAVKNHPQAHAAFLKSGEPLEGSQEDSGDKNFMRLVSECQTLRGCSKVDAMKRIARSHPNLHRQYIEQANQQQED